MESKNKPKPRDQVIAAFEELKRKQREQEEYLKNYGYDQKERLKRIRRIPR